MVRLRNKGFILLESLIGALILGIFMLYLAGGYAHTLQIMYHTNTLHNAFNLAESTAAGEGITINGYSVTASTGDFGNTKVTCNGEEILNVYQTP